MQKTAEVDVAASQITPSSLDTRTTPNSSLRPLRSTLWSKTESFGIRPEPLLVGLAPVEGVIPAAVLPVGILFCQRERGGESLSGSLLSPRQ